MTSFAFGRRRVGARVVTSITVFGVVGDIISQRRQDAVVTVLRACLAYQLCGPKRRSGLLQGCRHPRLDQFFSAPAGP